MRQALAVLALLTAAPAAAQVSYPVGPPPDMSIYAKASDIPQPATSLPPMEVVAGAVGSPGTYRPANAIAPRITRATTVTLISGGTFSGTWSTPLPAPPILVLTPIATGSAAVTCELTSAPTVSNFAGRCWSSQNTSITTAALTLGLTVLPNIASPAGTQVQVLAVPPTQ